MLNNFNCFEYRMYPDVYCAHINYSTNMGFILIYIFVHSQWTIGIITGKHKKKIPKINYTLVEVLLRGHRHNIILCFEQNIKGNQGQKQL